MDPVIVEKFWSFVDKGPDWDPAGPNCWMWMGNLHSSGRPRLPIGPAGYLWAHRVSWEIHRGPIPEDQWVYHRCSNKACVRPEHLALDDAFSGSLNPTITRWIAPKIPRTRGDYSAFLERTAKRPDKFARKPRIFKPGDKPWEDS